MKQLLASLIILLLYTIPCAATPVIYINQVGFDSKGPKMAIIGTETLLSSQAICVLIDRRSDKGVFTISLNQPQQMASWQPGRWFYQADFSTFQAEGNYMLCISDRGQEYTSDTFHIAANLLAQRTIGSIIQYYHRQRAVTPPELAADQQLLLYNSDTRVDMRGGWCDASGDVSKYFSHLAYANFMSPQQIPLVTWSMAAADEAIPGLLSQWGLKDSLENEALYGADYMMRALSSKGYFYMIVFSYFNKDPQARRVVGLHANSVTTDEYQCAFREGGGMAIAALARIARWKKNGDFTSQQYLAGAERAFAHLLAHNTEYDDDHKENIIDDYCALVAATELWVTTDRSLYRNEARKRAQSLASRLTKEGYFIADDGTRPFWHASDAGLPVIALSRYLQKETDASRRTATLQVIQQSLDYELNVTNKVTNPFGYARQTFRYHDTIMSGFFIPHDNETGWWWQGENARLGSLAAAAITGGRLVYPSDKGWGIKDSLAGFASRQVSWILGCNPYSMCFMYGFGKHNVPYMSSNFGHGSGKGGISNGITGKDGRGDGSGIDFKTNAEGNEWRWTEQWLPHAAWFLQAVAAMAEK